MNIDIIFIIIIAIDIQLIEIINRTVELRWLSLCAFSYCATRRSQWEPLCNQNWTIVKQTKIRRGPPWKCVGETRMLIVCVWTFCINVLLVYLFSPWLVQMVATAALCCQAAETHPGAGGGDEASTATEPCKEIQAKHKPGSKAAR